MLTLSQVLQVLIKEHGVYPQGVMSSLYDMLGSFPLADVGWLDC